MCGGGGGGGGLGALTGVLQGGGQIGQNALSTRLIYSPPPSRPKLKKPPQIDPAEQQRRADLAERIRRQRAVGGFGFEDTIKTSPLGLTGPGKQTLGA